MLDPDFRLSDDEDRWLDLYEAYLAHWLGVFRQPANSAEAIADHLLVIEFAAHQVDGYDGLKAFRAEHDRHFLPDERGAGAGGHFGIAYLARDDVAGVIVQAVVLLHPDANSSFVKQMSFAGTGPELSIKKIERSASSDTIWRWLASQLRDSAAITGTMQPHCILVEV